MSVTAGWRRAAAAALASGSAVAVLAAGAGWADTPQGPGGGFDGQTIHSSVRYDLSRNGGPGGQGPGPSGSWTPPACWFEPAMTPEQFKAVEEGIWAEMSVGADWVTRERDYYVNGHPYTNFNIGQPGTWWGQIINPAMFGSAAVDQCLGIDGHAMYPWVAAGNPPPPGAIDPLILAQLAYAQLRMPDTRVTINPAGRQTVNLASWMWLDNAVFHPVAVTATLDALGMSATTTATPVSLHLEPGTPDATRFPASGDCPIVGGRIGQPYRAGGGDPPCGVTYRRASVAGPFQLRATLTWHVTWTSPQAPGAHDLGNTPPFATAVAVAVQEIQTQVGGGH